MRWLLPIAAVLVTPVASAAPASDPAFLGIGMDNGPGYCSISSITKASPADEAGLQFGDMILAIDGLPVAGPTPCTSLQTQIVSHKPGEAVKLDVRRGVSRITIRATLSTRSDVLYRRFVGEPIDHTELDDIDNKSLSYDLAGRGKTTIVGWFRLEHCTNCARVFDRVSDGIRARLKDSDNPPVALAITAPARRGDLVSIRKSFTSNVSLAVADSDTFDTFALNDAERISFMVIDCRGVVRFAAPIAPDADDLDAALDDALAAVEQAEHHRTSRRN